MDTQITKLARQLRDDGVAPTRDLLPGIWSAIGDSQPQATPNSNSNSNHPKNFTAPAAWRLAAVAATLILLLGSGYFQSISQSPSGNKNVASADPISTTQLLQSQPPHSLLQSLNNTISDLAQAQALAPNNKNLTRLSLLTHKSRANLLKSGARR